MIKIKKNINLIADLSKMFPPKNRMYDKKKNNDNTLSKAMELIKSGKEAFTLSDRMNTLFNNNLDSNIDNNKFVNSSKYLDESFKPFNLRKLFNISRKDSLKLSLDADAATASKYFIRQYNYDSEQPVVRIDTN